MKIRNCNWLMLFLCLAHPPTTLSMDDSKHDVVVDLMGFMVQINNAKAVQEIGVATLGRAALGSLFGGGPKLTQFTPDFFETISRIQPGETPVEVFWQGHKAPPLLYDFLTSDTTSADILETVKRDIARVEPSNEALMHKLARITFDPAANVKIMQATTGARALLEGLKRSNQTIHVVANWHGEAYDQLETGPLATELALVNGQKIISGKTGKVKSPALYQQFLADHRPVNPIFIETQQQHIDHLREVKGDAVAILHEGDFNKTRRALIKYGALKAE